MEQELLFIQGHSYNVVCAIMCLSRVQDEAGNVKLKPCNMAGYGRLNNVSRAGIHGIETRV